MPPSEDFDINTLSIAEILFILNGELCDEAKAYVKFGSDLRAVWEELRINKKGHLQFLYSKIGFSGEEPDWPAEFYEAVSKYFDPKLTKKKELKDAIRGLDLNYEQLKAKHKRKGAWNELFDDFKWALEKYINQKAKARGIKPW